MLNKPVTNIALEGDFATGKSSVLHVLLKEKEIKKKEAQANIFAHPKGLKKNKRGRR